MPRPLDIAQNALATHLTSMGATLSRRVYGTGHTTLSADWEVVPVVAGLSDARAEYTKRALGRRVPVVPLCSLGNDLWAWFSYREEWDGARPAGRTKRFTFRSTGLTFYFGCHNTRHKVQIFRAEWAGWAKWNGTDCCYQAGGAAHPHWQFDALESLARADAGRETAGDWFASRSGDQRVTEAREFGVPSVRSEQVRDLVASKRLSRMHFASAAAWWTNVEPGPHVHTPGSGTEIRAWVGRTLDYVVEELDRLRK